MRNQEWLAEHFETHRPQLHSCARRMLGSTVEADDAVQEAWIRITRADTTAVQNPAAWLTTVVARICLNMLRARRTGDNLPIDDPDLTPNDLALVDTDDGDPEHRVIEADLVGGALLVVLDTLTPPERLAFILHDIFDLSYEEIGPLVGRSQAATRQLASRARRRVRGGTVDSPSDLVRRGEAVTAFLAASRSGTFDALLEILDPAAEARSDQAAAAMGSPPLVSGAESVANLFVGRALTAKFTLIDGAPGAVWMHGDTPRVVFLFTVAADRICAIDLVADEERIGAMHITEPGAAHSVLDLDAVGDDNRVAVD